MNHANIVFAISSLALINIIVNCNYSKEICIWVPSLSKKITLLLLLWLIPIFGATYLYYQKNLSPIRHYKAHEMNSGEITTGFLTEIDSITNPGKRHMIKAVEQQKIIRYERNKSNDSKNTDFSHFAVLTITKQNSLKNNDIDE